jgi:hypothetical protein
LGGFRAELLALNVIAMLLILELVPDPHRGFVLILTAPIFSWEIMDLDYVMAVIPSAKIRNSAAILAITVAISAFAYGWQDGYLVLSGECPLADVGASGLQLHSDNEHPVGYVRHISDFFVLYETTEARLVILKSPEVSKIVLMRNPKLDHAKDVTTAIPTLPSSVVSTQKPGANR